MADLPGFFDITGGTILGTDCSHGACVERLQGTEHHAFNGKCMCVVKADENAGGDCYHGDG